jgi:hypothetical protein
MKIRPVGAELLHADGQTDMTKLRVTFRNLANTTIRTCTVKQMTFFAPVGAKEWPLFKSGGRLRRVGADSRSQTVYRNDFLILVPTLGIGVRTWICLHYTRTLRKVVAKCSLADGNWPFGKISYLQIQVFNYTPVDSSTTSYVVLNMHHLSDKIFFVTTFQWRCANVED